MARISKLFALIFLLGLPFLLAPRVSAGGTNHPPRLPFQEFRPASVGSPYREKVVGWDRDRRDILTMTITVLPPGLSQGPCLQRVADPGIKQIGCSIVGTPTTSGTWLTQVFLTDDHGGFITTWVNLVVNP